MIVVDTSVWVDFFNGVTTPETNQLDSLLGKRRVLVGDIILAEVLQGFKRDHDFEVARRALLSFEIVSMMSPSLVIRSAENNRFLRKQGITIRRTLDTIIATFCIENGHHLLHADRDYLPFAQYLGLNTVEPHQ